MTAITPNTVRNILPKTAFEKNIYKMATSKPVQWALDQNRTNKNFYPNLVLGIIIAQNLIGTLTYTIASWNNKGMPKEQRKFAAAIDFMNGVFNFGVILTIGQMINKNSDKWAEKIAQIYKHPDIANLKGYNACKLGFRSVLTILVSGVLVQRVIVPFLATPAAKWLKEKYLSKPKTQDPNKNLEINNDRHLLYSKKLNQTEKIATSSNNNSDPFNTFEAFQKRINVVS